MASFKKSYVTYILIFSCATALLSAWLIFGRYGFLNLHKIQKEQEKYQVIMLDLKEKNRILAAEIKRLKKDKEYCESVARKELGLVRSNEIIYRLKRDSGGPHKGNETIGKNNQKGVENGSIR